MYENSFTLRKMVTAYGKPHHFSGRSTRTELLGYFVISGLVSIVASYGIIAIGLAGWFDLGIASFSFVHFLLWLPFPALAVRRLHDQNKPGWWAIPLILPTIALWFGGEELQNQPAGMALGALYPVVFVILFWTPSDGENRYGPDPRLDPQDCEATTTNA